MNAAALPTGFIGLGAMGAPMAGRILAAGIPLVVNDRDAKKVDALCAAGAEAAPDAKEIGRRCARTIVIVETAAQVRDVLLGPAGLAAGAVPGHQVACMATIDRHDLRAMAEELAARRIDLIDAPVSGSTEGAIAGSMAIFVGADEQGARGFDGCFRAMAKNIFHMGGLTKGLEIKLLNNMLAQTNSVAVAEVLAMATKAALDLPTVIAAIKVGTGNSAAFELRAPRMMRRDFTPGGTNDISYKDQELETAFAKELGVPVFLANVSQQVYQIARGMGLGKEDGSSLIKVYEALSGMKNG